MVRVTQRAIMRDLARKNGFDREATVRAYADAERRGEAPRKRNGAGMDADGYARALWADGVAKGRLGV